MKRKIFIFAAVLISATMAINVCAETEMPQNIYEQDFSIAADVSKNITPAANNSFSAEITDGVFDMKTDSLCFFRAGSSFASFDGFKNADEANNSKNSKGLKYYNKWWYKGFKLNEPQNIVHTDGKTYTVNYKVESGGNNALLLDEVGGLTAIGFHTYNNEDSTSKPVNTPNVKFVVGESAAVQTENNVKFIFKVYAEQANAKLKMTYINSGGETVTKELFSFAENEVGQWISKEVSITDINLSALVTQEASQQYTFRLATDLGYDIYLHSIEILKVSDEVEESDEINRYVQTVNNQPLYGDFDFSYELTFPSGEACFTDICGDACVTDCEYNNGKNEMTVNLLNQNEVEIAKVKYVLDGITGTVSLAYTDEGGNTSFEQIYEGELVDKEYRYKLSYDMVDATNTFSIFEGDEVIAETEAPLEILNKADAATTFVKYYSVEQKKSSEAIYSKIDNISVDFTESIEFARLMQDMASISLPKTVRGNFKLPAFGNTTENPISWEIEEAGPITIDGENAIVSRDDNDDITVTLKATISDGIFSVSSDFEVVVKALKGEFAEQLDVVESDNGETVTATTTLKNAGTVGADKISFVAVSYSGGEIVDREICARDVSSKYQKLDFTVTVDKGDEIKYYLWDENNVPIVNHAPHIYKADFKNKARGAVITWEKAYDDFDAVDIYQVVRSDGKVFLTDGEEYGENMLRFIDDEIEEGIEYSYELVALDSNQKGSDKIVNQAKKLPMPYSMDMTRSFDSAATYDGGNHISFIYTNDSERAAYTEHAVYHGEECTFIPFNKYAAFITDIYDIYKDIAIRYTYASPDEVELRLIYNGKQSDGSYREVSEEPITYPATDGWQTIDLKLDKEIRVGGTFSGGLFGIKAASSNGVYIKKVEFVKLEDYE